MATGLLARPARMSVELHPPVAIDKGTVVQHWAAGAGTVLVAGDDHGDLAAFDALRSLRAQGVVGFGVAVDGPEAPAELLAAADVVVEGPAGLSDFLVALAQP